MEVLWEKSLNEIKKTVKPHIFKTWFKELELISVNNTTITLKAKDKIIKEFIERNYLSLLKEAVEKAFNRNLNISIVHSDESKPVQLELSLPEREKQERIESNLNPKYTFENFIVGASNQFAHAAAMAVAENPGKAYNPLFIYGGVGLGKTHLMQAIGNFIKGMSPEKNVVYITTESFMNDLIESLRNDRMPSFREKYRTVDVLLIDDIQFISGKDRTQIEFFHTFNALYDNGKQVVLTSDRPPKDIPMLTERLKSRFEWGLIADIQPPDFETRIAILRKKAEIEGINVTDEVLRLLAMKIQSNIRQLEGSLLKLKAKAQLEGRPIDEKLINEMFGISKSSQYSEPLPFDRIKTLVSSKFDIKEEDLCSSSRKKKVTLARQIAMYLCRKYGNYSFPKIASAFNRDDHTTVMHAFNKIENLREKDQEINQVIMEIESALTVEIQNTE